ncbi:hypothetical protein H5410_062075 [Solanum commersonii]|uniref:Uncharacterized protein n=1 Tax=Solanum commersonii TaxID=4109 RepID=A0A9J5W9Q2_SOLCO|nr:hypothetical protein H5410_062075 [Solanum commersonii]
MSWGNWLGPTFGRGSVSRSFGKEELQRSDFGAHVIGLQLADLIPDASPEKKLKDEIDDDV